MGRFGALLQRGTLLGLLAVGALAAAAWWGAGPEALQPDRALYPVAAAPDSPWLPALHADERFQLVAGDLAALAEGRLALWLDDAVHHNPLDARSRAALLAFEQAAKRDLEMRMALEPDRAAAFPVEVNVLTSARPANPAGAQAAPTPTPDTTSDPTGASDGTTLLGQVPAPAESQLSVRPSEVQPPFPVRSLVMTFAYLIPMNFVAQMASGTLLAERVRRKGVLALSAPIPAWTILVGRMVPYAGLSAVVVAGAGLATGAGWVGWFAALPIVLFVLAISVVLGLLARHERELTFLLTGATTMLSVFLFLPAVFTAVPAVANVSPVTVIAASIRDETIGAGAFLYATLPLTLASLALALLALALYREETLSSQRPLAAKAVQALSERMGSPASLLAAGALAVPFAYALQLLVLAFVVPLGLLAAIPVVLAGGGFVKEALKAIPLRANLQGRAPNRWAGAWVGAGFFLGEKLALVVVLAGFTLNPLGDASAITLGAGTGLLLLAPLPIHVAAGLVLQAGQSRGGATAWLSWVGASALHLLYLVLLLAWLGGRL